MKEKFKELFLKGGTYSTGPLIKKALAIVLVPIYTTFLTTKDFGVVAMMMLAANLVGMFVSTPARSGFMRHYYAPEFEGRQKELFSSCALYSFAHSLVVAAVFYTQSEFLAKLILGDKEWAYVVEIFALVILGQPIRQMATALVQIQKRAKLYVFVNLSTYLAHTALLIYLLVFKRVGVLAPVCGAVLITWYGILVLLPLLVKNASFKVSFDLIKPALRYGYPLILASMSLYVLQMGDRYVLRLYTTLDEIGVYSMGYTIAAIMTLFLVGPMKQAINPIILQNEANKDEVRAFVSRACNYYCMLAVFLCMGLSVFCREALELLTRKPEFWAAQAVVPALAASYVFFGLRDLFGKGMGLAKKTARMSFIMAIAAIVNLAGNFALVPHYGAMGAAIATLISYIALCAMAQHYSRIYYGQTFDFGQLARIIGIGVALYLPSRLLSFDNFFISIPAKGCLVMLYPLALYLAGVFDEREKTLIKTSIRGFRFSAMMKGLRPRKKN